MRDLIGTVGTFARARWGLRFSDRETFLVWQRCQVDRFLRTYLPQAPYYRNYAGASLDQLPIVDKPTVLAHFSAFNTRAITLDHALAVALAAERSRDFLPTLDGLTVGLSSGTSGTRGVFLVSREERRRWAGLILARLLAQASLRQLSLPWEPALRVAFFLRANSNLYGSLASQRLRFSFHDLLKSFECHVHRLNAEGTDVLVAPPTVLHQLAEAQLDGTLRIAPGQVVSVAEVIEPDDRIFVERAFGMPLQEIYQATEGFLGASCPAGRLHLNEEFVLIEPEWLDQERRRFRPLVTDFTRTTQLVIRYRLDDVLLEAEGPCPCGRVTRSLVAVEGRSDDVLWWPSAGDDAEHPVFPDVVRRSMALAGRLIRDYRIEQRGWIWHVRVDAGWDDAGAAQAAARHELEALCRDLALRPPTLRFDPWIPARPLDKRRRIRCAERPAPVSAEP